MSPEPAVAFKRLEDVPDTTYLVFADGLQLDNPPSGWPRTQEGSMSDWRRARWEKLVLARVTSPLFEDETPLWSDDTYMYRVRFNVLTTIEDVVAENMNENALLALRYSTIQASQPALGPEPFRVDPPIPDVGAVDSESEEQLRLPDRILGEVDNLDGFARRRVRKEQAKLRRARFGDHAEVTCTLCGRILPVEIVRLAHIKRRSQAEPHELLNLNNTMAACTLGCDELFERRILTVDENGIVKVDSQAGTADLSDFLSTLENRKLVGYSPHQAEFYLWHRQQPVELTI